MEDVQVPVRKINAIAVFLRDALTIGAVVSAALSFAAFVVWAAFGATLARQASEVLGLDQLATRADMAALHARVDDVARRLGEVSGDNQITVVDLSRSFVVSPVTPGGLVDAVIYASRTERGQACIMISAAITFETQDGVRIPGPERAAASQLPATMTRLRFQYPAPKGLPAGRTGIWMTGHYECPWGRAVEEHGPLTFMVELPA